MSGGGEDADFHPVDGADPRFPLGFKLFYRQDQRMFSPQELMAFQPVPSVVEYE